MAGKHTHTHTPQQNNKQIKYSSKNENKTGNLLEQPSEVVAFWTCSCPLSLPVTPPLLVLPLSACDIWGRGHSVPPLQLGVWSGLSNHSLFVLSTVIGWQTSPRLITNDKTQSQIFDWLCRKEPELLTDLGHHTEPISEKVSPSLKQEQS